MYLKRSHRTGYEARLSLTTLGEGQMGSAQMGSLQIFMFFEQHYFGYSRLLIFTFPKVPGRICSPNLSKFMIFAAATLVLTPFVRNQITTIFVLQMLVLPDVHTFSDNTCIAHVSRTVMKHDLRLRVYVC